MPPLVYLVRHAHAVDSANDATRKLSPRGHEEVRQLARLLRASGAFRPSEVWHSPLVRAKETAEILVADLKLMPSWHERRELEPEADPIRVAQLVEKGRGPVALFGHEPHLSSLATLLVTGESGPIAFAFQKATLLALEPAGARWWVRWQLSPDLFETR